MLRELKNLLGKPQYTPILIPDGAFDKAPIADVFVSAAASIDGKVSASALEKIKSK
jgi:hypothetical protein